MSDAKPHWVERTSHLPPRHCFVLPTQGERIAIGVNSYVQCATHSGSIGYSVSTWTIQRFTISSRWRNQHFVVTDKLGINLLTLYGCRVWLARTVSEPWTKSCCTGRAALFRTVAHALRGGVTYGMKIRR